MHSAAKYQSEVGTIILFCPGRIYDVLPPLKVIITTALPVCESLPPPNVEAADSGKELLDTIDAVEKLVPSS